MENQEEPKRSKLLLDFEQTKDTLDQGLNPDETDKNKFIDQEKRKKEWMT